MKLSIARRAINDEPEETAEEVLSSADGMGELNDLSARKDFAARVIRHTKASIQNRLTQYWEKRLEKRKLAKPPESP